MFYEVRILNPKGDLKMVVSPQELSNSHWDSFNKIKLPNLESLNILREHKKHINATDYQAGSDA